MAEIHVTIARGVLRRQFYHSGPKGALLIQSLHEQFSHLLCVQISDSKMPYALCCIQLGSSCQQDRHRPNDNGTSWHSGLLFYNEDHGAQAQREPPSSEGVLCTYSLIDQTKGAAHVYTCKQQPFRSPEEVMCLRSCRCMGICNRCTSFAGAGKDMAHCGSWLAAVDSCACHQLWLHCPLHESALCECGCGETHIHPSCLIALLECAPCTLQCHMACILHSDINVEYTGDPGLITDICGFVWYTDCMDVYPVQSSCRRQ